MASLVNEVWECEDDPNASAFLRSALDVTLLLLKACEISHCIYHLRRARTSVGQALLACQ
jgi:hypothetical protein